MWIHSSQCVLNIWLFKCISHVNCLLYKYGLYVFLLICFIFNHKYGHITYRAAVQCVYFLVQVCITITCSLLNTVYYVCCVQIQVLHATCKILHYQQPILFVRNSSNIELKKEKHKSHNPWLLISLYWDKHRNHAGVEIRSMHEGNTTEIQNTGWGYVGYKKVQAFLKT